MSVQNQREFGLRKEEFDVPRRSVCRTFFAGLIVTLGVLLIASSPVLVFWEKAFPLWHATGLTSFQPVYEPGPVSDVLEEEAGGAYALWVCIVVGVCLVFGGTHLYVTGRSSRGWANNKWKTKIPLRQEVGALIPLPARKVAAILIVLSGILLIADRQALVYSESAMPILRKLGLAEVHVIYPHGLAPLESVQVVYAAALRTVVGTGVTLILGGTCLFITAGWRRRVKNPSGDFTLSKP